MNETAPPYLDLERVSAVKKTETPAYGLTRSGYTRLAGAPDCLMIRIDDRGPWRRLMYWGFSNATTHFVRIAEEPHLVAHPWELFHRAAREAREVAPCEA